MSDTNPQTPPQNPAPTGGDTPPATDPKGGGGATDDETVTLKKSDYNKLISQRDRANNTNKDQDDVIASLAQDKDYRDKVEYIDDWLESNKDKYPQVTRDDLLFISDPDQIEEAAKKRQRRYEDVIQDNLKNVQKAKLPVLSPEQREAEEKKLKENPTKGAFGKMLSLRTRR